MNGGDLCVMKDLRRKNSIRLNTALFSMKEEPSVFDADSELFFGLGDSSCKGSRNIGRFSQEEDGCHDKFLMTPQNLWKRTSSHKAPRAFD